MSGAGAVLVRLIRHLAPTDYHAAYPARVVSQSADGTLDVQPDSPKLPGLTALPIRGLPGVAVKVKPGARVLVTFEAGDPAAPVATLFQPDSLMELTITATTKVRVDAPLVELSDAAALSVARLGDMVQVISTPPGTPAYGTIISGTTKVRA